MSLTGIKKKRLLLAILLLFFLSLGGTFFFRPPVLIVTDASFIQLYGPARLRLNNLKTSLALFRRLIPVIVSENAGSDLVALAAAGAGHARAVLFPQRYLSGALVYKEDHPQTPVLVTGKGNPLSREEQGITFVHSDAVTDLYRAGLCAAMLTGNDKRILFFYDEVLPDEHRAAFREGLRDQGFLGDSAYINASADYSAYSDLGCVVVAGPASKFLEQNQKIPIILFSWADPSMTPRAVKLMFDSSPWALVREALRPFPPPAGEIFIASEIVLFPDRIDDKKDFRKLQAIFKEKFEKK